MRRIAAAVLAAGAGRRMGRPKADLVLEGRRLVDRAVHAAKQAGCDAVYAVVRAGTDVPDAHCVVNPDPERGMRSSLELAVAAATDAAPPYNALAVLLVDTPGIGTDAVGAVVAAWRPGRIALGSYAGRDAHPTVMDLDLWRAAVRLAGPDEGARALLRERADLVDRVATDGDPRDLDTPDDLAAWRARTAD